MRVLVIGTGSIGRRHAENLDRLGVAAEAQSMRAGGIGGALARLAEGWDAAVIATETQIRLELIAAAADAGIPLYIEKPLAAEPDEVSAIYAAAGPILERSMVGFMMRYNPAFRHLAAQDLSDAFRYTFEIGHDVTKWRANWTFAESYAARPEGGGVLLDLCHELDMAHCLFGGVISDVESLGHVRYPGVDMATQVARAGPVQGTVAMDYLAPVPIRRVEIAGTQRRRVLDFHTGRFLDGDRERLFEQDRNAMFLAIMADFLALVRGRPVSEVEFLPRLDLARASCEEIARAHSLRRFTGHLDGPVP
ncbi:MAG: Gfo/Idh/MocA family oxidoreductase [Rhodobacteraceae bacterium]|nr:Gfo/Idh/MocA family oxidoreductase [Paracoccaceae bacterium]